MGYTRFDRLVAWFRFRAGLPYIRARARVCDLGCGLEGQFLQMERTRISFGVGVDYQVSPTIATGIPLVRADLARKFPFRDACFDHAVAFAVLEHLVDPGEFLKEAFRIIAPGGSLILTYPHATLDPMLKVLHKLGLVSDEMESEKHQRRIPLPELLAWLRKLGFERTLHRTFEFGLNNLVVSYKPR